MSIVIKAMRRTEKSEYLHKAGKIPAVAYGVGYANTNLSVLRRDITNNYAKLHSSVFTLNIEGKNNNAIIRDIQWHVLNDLPVHIDFQFVDDKRKIKVAVPVVFINAEQSPTIKRSGMIHFLYRKVNLYCMPNNIPKQIEVDLSTKRVGTVIRLGDLALPQDAKLAYSRKDIVVARVIDKARKKAAKKEEKEESEE